MRHVQAVLYEQPGTAWQQCQGTHRSVTTGAPASKVLVPYKVGCQQTHTRHCACGCRQAVESGDSNLAR